MNLNAKLNGQNSLEDIEVRNQIQILCDQIIAILLRKHIFLASCTHIVILIFHAFFSRCQRQNKKVGDRFLVYVVLLAPC